MHRLYECGICSCLHPWEWDGDCRDNSNRYADEQDYLHRNTLALTDDIEVFSWDDRLMEDTRVPR